VDNTELKWATTQNIIVVVTTIGSTGTSKYRIWSDGWCEQMGKVSVSSANTAASVSLVYPYINANYHICVNRTAAASTATTTAYEVFTRGISSNGFDIFSQISTSFMWYACGYIS
jgi:hypothetical protein